MALVSGATREEKRCRRCDLVKPRAEFTVRQSGSRVGHLSSYCRNCNVSAQQARVKRDAGLYRRVEWPSKLRSLYGIAVEDYHRMLTIQNGGCAVCGTSDPTGGNRQYARHVRTAFDVDHCHTTGRVRGLLCTRCNRLVGLAQDNPDTARRLALYLSKE